MLRDTVTSRERELMESLAINSFRHCTYLGGGLREIVEFPYKNISFERIIMGQGGMKFRYTQLFTLK